MHRTYRLLGWKRSFKFSLCFSRVASRSAFCACSVVYTAPETACGRLAKSLFFQPRAQEASADADHLRRIPTCARCVGRRKMLGAPQVLSPRIQRVLRCGQGTVRLVQLRGPDGLDFRLGLWRCFTRDVSSGRGEGLRCDAG